MSEVIFNNRRAVTCENDHLRLTVTCEGGHLCEVYDKQAEVSPLWVPQWTSIEPSSFTPEKHPVFGTSSESLLLAGIMGHNLCLDLFGGPSAEEEAQGYSAHGEASVLPYQVSESEGGLRMRAHLPLAQLEVTREIRLFDRMVRIRENLTNLTAMDRPIGWTQHVTLGAPFLDPAKTEFRASMTRSLTADEGFGSDDPLEAGREFRWPLAPKRGGGESDLRQMHIAPASGYTAHLADPAREDACFVAFSAEYELAFGYVWKRADFPWMGIWEENRSRQRSPWDGREVARGMEFGMSPFPESRKKMVERGTVFGVPGFGWLPARGVREVEYWICSQHATRIPEMLAWPNDQ